MVNKKVRQKINSHTSVIQELVLFYYIWQMMKILQHYKNLFLIYYKEILNSHIFYCLLYCSSEFKHKSLDTIMLCIWVKVHRSLRWILDWHYIILDRYCIILERIRYSKIVGLDCVRVCSSNFKAKLRKRLINVLVTVRWSLHWHRILRKKAENIMIFELGRKLGWGTLYSQQAQVSSVGSSGKPSSNMYVQTILKSSLEINLFE